jgi:two-component system cell cycle response regulator CtrA
MNVVGYAMELEAYMRQGDSESTIRTGMLVVNLDTRVVSVNEKPVHLTGKEYGILELLNLRKGTTLTKEMFLDHLYDGMDEPEIKIIDVFVCKLRKKLAQATGGSHYIETVWGRGYVLRDPPPTTATGQGPGLSDLPGEARFKLSHQPAHLLASSAAD